MTYLLSLDGELGFLLADGSPELDSLKCDPLVTVLHSHHGQLIPQTMLMSDLLWSR